MGVNSCGDVLHPPYIACCENGYQASLGWDPVSKYKKLYKTTIKKNNHHHLQLD